MFPPCAHKSLPAPDTIPILTKVQHRSHWISYTHCIIDAILPQDLEFFLEASTIGTKMTFPNSDKKRFWGVTILPINKKFKYQIL